jgi:hypothetical protein
MLELETVMKRGWNLVLTLSIAFVGAGMVSATEDDFEPPPPAEMQVNGRFMVEESNFDQWVFQGTGNATAGRARLVAMGTLKLNELIRVCDLTEAQQKKLKLAIHGDLTRFFEEVEVVRKKFLAVRNDQNAFNQIWQEINPLQTRQQAGLFGESSLFAKAVRRTLNEEQQAKYRAVTDERRRFRYRASVELTLISLSNTAALRHDQHDALAALLIEQTEPLLKFGQYDEQAVLFRLATLPSAKVRAILDDRQWKLIQPQLNQSRAMGGFLAQNGIIVAPKDAATGILGKIGNLEALFGGARGAFATSKVETVEDDADANDQAVRRQVDAPADALKPDQPPKEASR